LQVPIQNYFDLVVVLAQKEFKIRYRNSVLGFLWSLLNPLGYMLILTLVFWLLVRVSVSNYPAWVLLGLLVWRFFSVGTSQSLNSIIGNASLVNKVYLPRYLIVLSNNLANFLGATLEFVVFLPLIVLFGVNLSVLVFLLPILLVLEFLLIVGLSLALSALNLKYRDFYQLWEIVLQLGFFVSPIIYDPDVIPARYRAVYSLNPMASIIDSVRSICLYNRLPSVFDVIVLIASIALFLALGLAIFRHFEPGFAEEI